MEPTKIQPYMWDPPNFNQIYVEPTKIYSFYVAKILPNLYKTHKILT